MALKDEIICYLANFPGATDSELANHLQKSHQQINQACRNLENGGQLIRRR